MRKLRVLDSCDEPYRGMLRGMLTELLQYYPAMTVTPYEKGTNPLYVNRPGFKMKYRQGHIETQVWVEPVVYGKHCLHGIVRWTSRRSDRSDVLEAIDVTDLAPLVTRIRLERLTHSLRMSLWSAFDQVRRFPPAGTRKNGSKVQLSEPADGGVAETTPRWDGGDPAGDRPSSDVLLRFV